MLRILRTFLLPALLLAVQAPGAAQAADDPYIPGGPRAPPLPIDNARFATPNGQPTKALGGGGGTSFIAACPAGSALVGWIHNTTLQLTAVAPICQRVVDGELLGRQGATPPAAVGFEAANAVAGFERRCADHMAVRGLQAAVAADQSIFAIRSICFAPSGGSAPAAGFWTAVRLLKGTKSDYLPKTRPGVSCSGSYATGLAGTFSGGVVTSIGLLCEPRTAQAAAPGPVEVRLPVDLFGAAGGDGPMTGRLDAGTADVTLVEACRDDWCHVRWPGHEGWVYSGPDYNALGR